MFREQMENIAELAKKANLPKEGDYISPDDGLLYCGRCHSNKQCRITFLGVEQIVFCMCKCKMEEAALERERRQASQREIIRRDCFEGSDLVNATFDKDDGANKALSQVCRAYANKFSPSSNWLLLYGSCGIGKSFAAACIVNELINKGYYARFVTVGQVERQLFGSENKAYELNRLHKVDVLCIDDFGAERNTEYMQQIAFDLIDGRLKSGRPCIITTNLTPDELCNPKSFEAKRIYSRIYEKAIPFEVNGSDRRFKKLMESGKARLNELLSD